MNHGAVVRLGGFTLLQHTEGAQIVYSKLGEASGGGPGGGKPRSLVDSGLKKPRGIAVDTPRRLLYVADEGLRKVLVFRLSLDTRAKRIGETGASGRSGGTEVFIVPSLFPCSNIDVALL